MRRLIAALLAACGLLAGPALTQETGNDRAIIVHAEPVALYPGDLERTDLDRLTYRGGLVLTSPDPGFGGFSAIGLTEDGTGLVAISDRGQWLTAELVFDETGAVAGLETVRMAPLLAANGSILPFRSADAEGLAYRGDGVWLVSFEREHRVEAYEIGPNGEHIATALPHRLALPPDARALPDNGSLEALAVQSGFAWVGVEHPSLTGIHTIYRYDLAEPDRAPDAFPLRLMPGFGLVSLAGLGDGRLLAVERFYARGIGNRIRVSVVAEARITGVQDSTPPTLLALFTPAVTVDNLEGAAIFHRDGRQHLLLISDDNFSSSQRALLLSFVLPE